jgi:hypothetical protein
MLAQSGSMGIPARRTWLLARLEMNRRENPRTRAGDGLVRRLDGFAMVWLAPPSKSFTSDRELQLRENKLARGGPSIRLECVVYTWGRGNSTGPYA